MIHLVTVLAAIGLLSCLAIGATVREVVRDGYRAIPTDPRRAPRRSPGTEDRSQMRRRVIQLLLGLPLFGVGTALTVEAGLGLDPWTVLAQGISLHTGIGVGWVTNLLGVLVLLAWIPLRQKPGLGTVLNILIVGTALQVALDALPPMEGVWWRIAGLLGGIVLVGLASGLYIGAQFGTGPRDGLMTGLHRRLGWPVWGARATVELTVLALGWLLGGTVGWGTLAFAVLIGPCVDLALRLLDTRRPAPSPTGPMTATA
ncbi:membrane protein YczE [Microbacterium rhizophilus]|uniref:membrane protein YczE n=1 Tax=Microbacterium rhizophilus TaxID=3138934 RepID=UPI0031E75111